MAKFFITLIFACVFFHVTNAAINWNGLWAHQCDFKGNDLASALCRGEDCSNVCRSTSGCTHYVWTTYNGGTCWMKKGNVRKEDAFLTNDPVSVCGIVDGSSGQPNQPGGGLSGSSNNRPTGALLKKGALIWNDEFDNHQTYLNNWRNEVGGWGWGNNELQFYTDNQNTQIKDSNLIIEAKREDRDGRQFTSARVLSRRTFKYGVYEIRAKLPRGRGTWPAIWMLGQTNPFKWPDSGEIDIMEHVGFDMNRVHGNIHCARYNHAIGTGKGNNVMVSNVADEYHLYQVEWTSNKLSFYIDNKEYFTYNKEDNGNDGWPFDNPHIIILNIAVGGNWGGQKGVDHGVFPQKFYIDYVRHYDLA